MLTLFAVILGGILTGRLLSGRRLPFLTPAITAIIRILLLLLGIEVGSDPAVADGMATLGRSALVVFAASVAGSIGCSWLLWRRIVRRGISRSGSGAGDDDALQRDGISDADASATVCGASSAGSVRTALGGSLVIVAFFAAGCLAGWSGLAPFAASRASAYVLYLLMFAVGITLGHDTSLAGQVRRLDPRLALLPVATAAGTLAGAAVVGVLYAPLTVPDSLAVGAGFGYYSLSSIFIADLRSVELGTVALLCNVMREIFTLVAAPLVARLFGPLAAVSIGGATSFDTTLPVITQAAGRPYAVVSIFHGCLLDVSVPFLVTLFCSI